MTEERDPPEQRPEQPPERPGPRLSEYAHPEEEVPQEVRTPGRGYPSTIGGLVYLVVLGTTLVGVALASTGRWRVGMLWVGASLLAAAVVRLLIPEGQAGMLHVRRRLVDVLILVLLGGGLLAAAASIPLP